MARSNLLSIGRLGAPFWADIGCVTMVQKVRNRTMRRTRRNLVNTELEFGKRRNKGTWTLDIDC